jgi:hypothetical protein
MSVCLTQLRDAAKEILSDEDAKALLNEIQSRAKAKAQQGIQDINDALDQAAQDIFDAKARQAQIEKRNAYLNILVKDKIDSTLRQFKNEADGLEAITGGIQSNIKNSRFSTNALQKSQTNALAGRFLMELRKNDVLDIFNDKSLEPELAGELFREGTSSNPQVRKLASVIRDTYRIAIKKLNAAGADIGELDNYIARQTHNAEKMLQTSDRLIDRIKQRFDARKRFGSFEEARKYLREEAYQKWKNFILPRLDPNLTFDGVDPEEFLRGTYDGLVSGVHLQKPLEEDNKLFAFKGPANRAKKLSAQRVLHFKDGSSWYEYNQRYGAGTVHNAIISTLRKSGENIGLLKMWGPNPRAMFDKVSREIKEQSRSSVDFKKLQKKLTFSEHVFSALEGNRGPTDNLLAKIGASIRGIQTMAKLGGVVLSSIPDLAIRASLMRSHGVGILDSYKDALMAMVRGTPKGEMKLLTDSLGTWAESEFGHMVAYFSAADSPAGFMTKSIQTFFKLTGMEWWDHVHRTSVGTALSRLLALQKGKAFLELHAGEQRALNLYGIGEKEWDLIRTNPFKMFNGEHYITPDAARNFTPESIANYLGKDVKALKPYEIEQVKEDIEDRLQTYFIDQVDHANIQPHEADRQVFLRGTQAGTVYGELARFIAQFKYFSIGYVRRVLGSHVFGYGADNLHDAFLGGKGDILGLAHLIIGSTILGYVAMSAKNLFKGLEPRDPTDKGTWLAAMLQGGGAGIYGDYLFGEYNRFGQSLISTAAGPALGTINDVASLFAQIRDGQDPTNATFRLVKNNMPFLNLFYTRTALDYLILYGIQEHISPGSLRRMQHTISKQNNQQYWLPPTQYANQ